MKFCLFSPFSDENFFCFVVRFLFLFFLFVLFLSRAQLWSICFSDQKVFCFVFRLFFDLEYSYVLRESAVSAAVSALYIILHWRLWTAASCGFTCTAVRPCGTVHSAALSPPQSFFINTGTDESHVHRPVVVREKSKDCP